MNASEFIQKWSKAALSERAGSHDHFNDLCDPLGIDRPSVADPKGGVVHLREAGCPDM